MLPWRTVILCRRVCTRKSRPSLLFRSFLAHSNGFRTDNDDYDLSSQNFIKSRILVDMNAGANDGKQRRLALRFPPEPNGYMHIGHAKSVCLNFGLAKEFQGTNHVDTMCFLRFDDTNPSTASQKFVDGIVRDVRWLGFNWDGPPRFTSDYFDRLYDCAKHLIQNDLAYVCDLSPSEAKAGRGVPQVPNSGTNSPYRERSVSENMQLFEEMRKGNFEDGVCVLRAKIDMASPNMHMRDPTLYRIKRSARHFRTGQEWPIYPTYDFAHCLSDAIEGITHSLCTLEFEVRGACHSTGSRLRIVVFSAYVRTYVRTCVCVRARARVSVCMCAFFVCVSPGAPGYLRLARGALGADASADK